MEQAKREALGVERQLMRNGKVEQAERLRASMGSMMGGMTAPVNPHRAAPDLAESVTRNGTSPSWISIDSLNISTQDAARAEHHVVELKRISGGSSRETYSFDLEWSEGGESARAQ